MLEPRSGPYFSAPRLKPSKKKTFVYEMAGGLHEPTVQEYRKSSLAGRCS